jgi:hypothetical protein
MPTQAPPAAPWQELEKQAYHAWREWPIWLVLRERELAARQERHAPAAAPDDPAGQRRLPARRKENPS